MWRALAVVAAGILMTAGAGGTPVRLILDTDVGNDIDDAFALAMIHALADRGEVRMLAVTISKDNRWAAPFVEALDTFYGRPDIPIGVVRGGKTPEDGLYLRPIAESFPTKLKDGAQAPEAVDLLTRVLEAQPDSSVTIAQIGFSTNLARLLQRTGGRELVKRKVRLLSVMGGNFLRPEREYNIYTDPEAASVLLSQWPTPMVFSGFEVGLAVRFPYASFASGFGYVKAHPIVAAAQAFFHKPEDRPSWDPTAVLAAIRPEANYFELSTPGRVSLGANETTVFTPDRQGRCRYLILRPEQSVRVQQLLVDLVTEPPAEQLRR